MPKEEPTTSKPAKDAKPSSAIEKNPCAQCRIRGYLTCTGHGKGGGGSSEGKGDELKIVSASTMKPGDIFFMFKYADDGSIKVVDNMGNDLKSKEVEEKLLFHNLQELFKQQLEIIRNPKDLTLTIKIKAGLPQDQKEILQEFLTLLKQKCNSLVLTEPKNKFLAAEYKLEIDDKKGELKIYLPEQKLYQDIIKYLSKNASTLLDQAKQQRVEKQESLPSQEKASVGKLPNPFKTRLTRN